MGFLLVQSLGFQGLFIDALPLGLLATPLV